MGFKDFHFLKEIQARRKRAIRLEEEAVVKATQMAVPGKLIHVATTALGEGNVQMVTKHAILQYKRKAHGWHCITCL